MSDGTKKSAWTRGYNAGYAKAEEDFERLMENAMLVRRRPWGEDMIPIPHGNGVRLAGRTRQYGKNNGEIERVHGTKWG